MEVTKAIILAAGYGTRFLPVTKAMPKEMLPVVDKPVIQYVVEDAVSAGIQDIIIVTSAQKRPIEDHFDHSYELEQVLELNGKDELLQQVRAIANMANFIYVRQKGAKGTMPAIQSGYHVVGEEPFLAIWGDDFFMAQPSRCQQLIDVYHEYKAPVLCSIKTNHPDHTKRYGYVAGHEVAPNILQVERIVEKPGPDAAPSDCAVVAGALLTPEAMAYGRTIEPSPNGEYLYVDALEAMIKDGKPVYALSIQNATYYDCGNKLDYIKATIDLALKNPAIGPALRDYLRSLP